MLSNLLKIKNLKFHKTGIKLLSVGIAGMILLSGCGSKDRQTSASYTSRSIPSSTSAAPIPISTAREPDDYVEGNIIGTPIVAQSEDYNLFQSYLNQTQTDYLYSELYCLDEALSKIQEDDSELLHTYDIRNSDGKITVDSLVKVIVKNNELYWNSGGIMTSFYDQMSESEITKVCEVLVEYINKRLEMDPSIDRDRVCCKLGNLKMFYKATSSNAYISNDDCFIISPNMLSVMQIMNDDQNVERNVFIHEGMHLIQDGCMDQENENITRVGICTEYRELKMNPLFWKWYIEASAEKNMCHMTGDPALTYEPQINYLNSLSFVVDLSSKKPDKNLEDLCFFQDVDMIFEQFGCTNIEEKKEIMKLMCAIDIIQTEREDFLDQYKEATGKEMTADELVEYKRKIKGSLCQTLAKCFYRNLADQVMTGQATFEDVFYLMKVFEADCFSHINYDNPDKKEAAMPFLETYTDIQDSFFTLIAGDQYRLEDVETMFQNYSIRIYEGDVKKERNCDLKWLDDSKKEAIFQMQDAVYSKTITSIRETSQMEVSIQK